MITTDLAASFPGIPPPLVNSLGLKDNCPPPPGVGGYLPRGKTGDRFSAQDIWL